MGINKQKVLIGGIAAGVIMSVIDFIVNGFILGDRMRADANAFRAGLGDEMATPDGTMIAGYVITSLITGILLVWTYAAIRPRFGPGPATALKASLLFWVFGALMTMGYMNMGMMSSGLWVTYALIWLVNLIIAGYVGSRLYSEAAPG